MSYPVKFTAAHKEQAKKLGFSNVLIKTFQGRNQDSLIELDYLGDDDYLYTVTWQLAGQGGFPGSRIFVGRGVSTWDDLIRLKNGDSCHDFASFADFLALAAQDIERRELRRKETCPTC